MTSEARLKELAAMLANHPFLGMAIDEINGLEQENAELRQRVESLEGALRECDSFLSGQIAYMYQRHLEIVDGERLVEENVRDIVRAALSQANAPAKPESQEEEEEEIDAG